MKVATWLDPESESYLAWCYSPRQPFEVCSTSYGMLRYAIEKTARGDSSWGGFFEITFDYHNFGIQKTRGSVKETADELMSRFNINA